MARPRPWTVLPHNPIRRFGPDLWEVEGDTPKVPLPRRMVVIRLSTGQLVIHNGVALEDELMAEIEALGTPSVLVVPNHFHGLDAHAYKERYPDVHVVCPEARRAKIAKRISIDGSFEDLPADARLRVETIDGGKMGEAAFIFTADDGEVTLVFNDAIFNVVNKPRGFKGWLIRMMGSTGGPKVTWIGRRLVVRDKKAFAAHLRRLAQLPGLARIILGHGDIIEDGAAGVLRGVADRLSPA